MAGLEGLKADELRAEARARGFERVSRLSKADLISRLETYAALDGLSEPSLRALAAQAGVEGAQTEGRDALRIQLATLGVRPEAAPGSASWSARLASVPAWFQGRSLAAEGMRFFGAAGVVLSLVAMLFVPLVTLRAVRGLQAGLRSTAGQVESVADLLLTADGALAEASDALRTSSEALLSVKVNLDNTEPVLETVALVVGEQAPDTIEATREALTGAEAGAAAIDQALRVLSALSPLTGFRYNPPQTLDQSLALAVEGLAPLPDALRGVQTDLEDATADLNALKLGLSAVSEQLGTLADDLEEVGLAVGGQGQALTDLAEGLEDAADRAPLWGAVGAGVTLVLLAWMALTQYAVYSVGNSLRHPTSPGD